MRQGISASFRKYRASLKNVNWSVSAWVDEETLVVSLWAHHVVMGAGRGALTFSDRFDRWSGPGNNEFRANVTKAFGARSKVRLVLARAQDPERVQGGEDGSKIPKSFSIRDDLIGQVTKADGESYVIEFRKIQEQTS